MATVADLCEWMEHFAPSELAEDWDNVGLLVGDRHVAVRRIMTCLTVTPESVAEAVAGSADLVITHHPLPFRPLARITSETTAGRMLLELIRAGIAVYSPHTRFDSAAGGINQRLAEGLQLERIAPLVPGASPAATADGVGSGRVGEFPEPPSAAELVDRVKRFLGTAGLMRAGEPAEPIRRLAVACGAAGSFLEAAAASGCQAFLTGETNFHTALEAKARGLLLLLPGHYATERFALEGLAAELDQEFADLEVWASRAETDPLVWE